MTDLVLCLVVSAFLCVTFIFILFYKNVVFNIRNAVMIEKKLDVLLRKRWFLIPHIVNIMKSSIDKSKCLEDIIVLKNRIYDNMDFSKKIIVGSDIDKKMLELITINSNNDYLRSNKEYGHLCVELNYIDNEIEILLNDYNDTVKVYNNNVDKLMYRFISKIMGYKKMEIFK